MCWGRGTLTSCCLSSSLRSIPGCRFLYSLVPGASSTSPFQSPSNVYCPVPAVGVAVGRVRTRFRVPQGASRWGHGGRCLGPMLVAPHALGSFSDLEHLLPTPHPGTQPILAWRLSSPGCRRPPWAGAGHWEERLNFSSLASCSLWVWQREGTVPGACTLPSHLPARARGSGGGYSTERQVKAP